MCKFAFPLSCPNHHFPKSFSSEGQTASLVLALKSVEGEILES